MVEIVKTPNKAEYSIENLGTTKPKMLIGGRDSSVGLKVVPNVNWSFECESGVEQYFINLNKPEVVLNEKEVFSGLLSLALEVNHIWHIDNGIFKWDIEYAKDPRPTGTGDHTETWTMKHSPELIFFYQPPLEDEYKNDPDGCVSLEEFLQQHSQPENVTGSYAVYCGKSGHIRNVNGTTRINRGTGKLCHIYRPHLTDADGKEGWGELLIDGDLSITISEAFLDAAVFPVTIDGVDVGNSHCGAATSTIDDTQRGIEGTSSGAGTGDSLWACIEDVWGSGEKVKMALYLSSDGSLISSDVNEQSGGHASTQFVEFPFNTGPTVDATTAYISVVWGDSGGSALTVMRDSFTANRYYKSETYGSWPNPHGGTFGSGSYYFSTYLEYTESAGGGLSIPNPLHRPLAGPMGGPL